MSYFQLLLVYVKYFLHILSCRRILLGMNHPYIRRRKSSKGVTQNRNFFSPHTNHAAQATAVTQHKKKSEETAMLNEKPYKSDYNDGNIPEIDLPRESNATDVIPDEVPRKDGPGGEG